MWSEYTGCSTTCGEGKKTKIRLCNNPPSEHEGLECLLSGSEDERGKEESEIKPCLKKKCPGENLCYFSGNDSSLGNQRVRIVGYDIRIRYVSVYGYDGCDTFS